MPAGVCGCGARDVVLLVGAVLFFDGGPAVWDGEEDGEEGAEVEEDGEDEFLVSAGAARLEGIGVAVEDLALLPGAPVYKLVYMILTILFLLL